MDALSAPGPSRSGPAQEFELEEVDKHGKVSVLESAHTPQPHGGVLSRIPPQISSGRRLDTQMHVRTGARQGDTDPMQRFAALQSKLQGADSEPPSRLTSLMQSLAPANLYQKATGLLSAKPEAVDQSLAHVHRSVIGASFEHSGAQPTTLLGHLNNGGPHALSNFWSDPSIGQGVVRPSPQLLKELDRMAGKDRHLSALALSFAFQSATEPHKVAPPAAHEIGALRLLQAPDMLDKMSARVARGKPDNDPHVELAYHALQRAAQSNQFPEMLGLLGHKLDERKLDALQGMLQASALANRRAAGGEADEAGGGNTATTFARRTQSAFHQLLAHGEEAMTPQQKADVFAWQNGFRDDGPGSPLATVKARLADLAEAYGCEDDALATSPLRAARMGLGGADLRTLKEEGADVRALADSPAVETLVDLLREQTAARIHAAQSPDDKAKLIAQLVALDAWTPAQKRTNRFELNDVVNGRGFDTKQMDSVPRTALDSYCLRAARNRPVLTGEGNEQAAAPGSTEARSSADLARSALRELADTRIGIADLAHLANEYAVTDEQVRERHRSASGVETDANQLQAELPPLEQVFAQAARVIDAKSARPASSSPEDAIKLVRDFFSSAQFGNNVRYSRSRTEGLSSRGFAYNIAHQVYADAQKAAHQPVLVRGNLSTEVFSADVVRYGVATHGGEWSFGHETRYTNGGGGGLQGGRNFGPEDHTSLARIAGGLDIGFYAHDYSSFDGIMIRSMRRVNPDSVELDATPPRFAHFDKEVRDEMAELQPTIRKRSLELMERKRAGTLDEDIGDEMLKTLADKGMSSGLSLGLTQQVTTTHRSDMSASVGGSLTTAGENGARFGASASSGIEKVWRARYEQTDETGAVRVVNHREGSYTRMRGGATSGINAFVGSAGVPPTDAASASILFDEIGANAKVRFVYHKDKLVPRFCFSDAEFPDVQSYERYLNHHREEYSEMFSHLHGGDLAEGSKELDAHIELVKGIRAQNHINYARARLREEHAQRLDEYRGIGALVPPQMARFKAELESTQEQLIGDPKAFSKASGITYAPYVDQEGFGQSVAGVRLKASTDMYAEREIIFDTIGWARLKNREDGSAVEIDPSGKRA
ncbi:hypothetical protein [Paraburkholderia sp. SOS3]|jgi:hypothetical protein|uniref:hypothetical protein n=1 Tax=Paraburkholderia sp. SOS3 TaxID=1926494 RepID=UPI0009476E88|nr:hypothetical protein [Paraburkholderia sp. SOS3]APR38331.1 hypothetical protein BTO02_22785 [Paraburkholderia sp. SOS3]